MKNMPCVNRTIEIALEQIQHNITANSQRQNRGEFMLCVSRHLHLQKQSFVNAKMNVEEKPLKYDILSSWDCVVIVLFVMAFQYWFSKVVSIILFQVIDFFGRTTFAVQIDHLHFSLIKSV